ncbi:MAG: GNAT family N-acetyltransferase [Spirochaetales bacterium]|nr:GNAT family N-acetyltransferase [Spirochaetales bacterium]
MFPIRDRELEIRPVKTDEMETVFQIYRECEDFLELGPVPKASMDMVIADIDSSKEENRFYCGIIENKIMAGIIDFCSGNYSDKPNQAYLALLMIAKPYRKRGLGTRVVTLIESEIIKNKKIEYIYSGVQVNNGEAIKFWKRNGYQIYAGPELMEDRTIVYHLRKRV